MANSSGIKLSMLAIIAAASSAAAFQGWNDALNLGVHGKAMYGYKSVAPSSEVPPPEVVYSSQEVLPTSEEPTEEHTYEAVEPTEEHTYEAVEPSHEHTYEAVEPSETSKCEPEEITVTATETETV
ncbi:hypothetical protein IWW50_004578, partial [Coemansia erecta]